MLTNTCRWKISYYWWWQCKENTRLFNHMKPAQPCFCGHHLWRRNFLRITEPVYIIIYSTCYNLRRDVPSIIFPSFLKERTNTRPATYQQRGLQLSPHILFTDFETATSKLHTEGFSQPVTQELFLPLYSVYLAANTETWTRCLQRELRSTTFGETSSRTTTYPNRPGRWHRHRHNTFRRLCNRILDRGTRHEPMEHFLNRMTT